MTPGKLSDIIRKGILAYMETVHFALPAEVVKYDAATKKIDAHPLIKLAFHGQSEITFPTISAVPVMFPGSSDAVIQFPLVKGDSGLLVCSERSLEQWLASTGGEASPGDPRHFSLTDAVFLPGLFPFQAPGKIGQKKEGLELVYKGVEIQIDDNGNVSIAGDSKSFVTYDELNSALTSFKSSIDAAMAGLITAHTHVCAAPGTPSGPGVGSAPATSLDISAAKTTHIKTGG